PNGRLLAGANSDNSVTLWDLYTHREYRILEGNDNRFPCLAFSPNGRWLAVGGPKFSVNVWELPAEVRGPGDFPARDWLVTDGSLRCVALRPDGKELAVGGEDGSVTLWPIGKEAPRLTLKGHSRAVVALAYAPDGKSLLSAGLDGKP